MLRKVLRLSLHNQLRKDVFLAGSQKEKRNDADVCLNSSTLRGFNSSELATSDNVFQKCSGVDGECLLRSTRLLTIRKKKVWRR